MTEKLNILLLEDSEFDADLIKAQVAKSGVSAKIERVVSRQDFENAVRSTSPDLILSDYALPDFDGISALEFARKTAPRTPFIFVSGTLGEDVAIDALHNGATDYVLKQRLDRLSPAVRRVLDEIELRKRQSEIDKALQASQLRFRELADAIPNLIWATDAAGKLTYANRHARLYHRSSANEEPIFSACHPDDRPLLERIWNHCLRSGEACEVEFRLSRDDESAYRWHLGQFVPMHDKDKRLEGWVATAIEIEEQKQREQSLRESESALLRAQETLEQKVAERTEAYAKLSARLLTIQDEERRRFAREMHDGFGQTMVAIKMILDTLASLSKDLSERRKEELLAQSSELLADCLAQVRTISYLLHPPLLDESGFAQAAQWYVSGFSERSRIKTKLQLPPTMERLPAELELVLFRVLQAGLTNVNTHAKAQNVYISLQESDDQLIFEIRDDGTGIPEEKLYALQNGSFDVGVGLAGMRERVRDLKGSLEIKSDRGTTILVTLPRPRPLDEKSLRASEASTFDQIAG